MIQPVIMELEPSSSAGPSHVLCCECGVPIIPNPVNMCVVCLRRHVDITEHIPKQATISFCQNCERYLNPPADWIHCGWQTPEMLRVCLKKLKALKTVKLVDADFEKTECHSRRIKLKLKVQGEVQNGAVLEQVFTVEFTVSNLMCDDCHRINATNFWRAMVQVRQKTDNKKTFFYLEQLILKHKAHLDTVNIKPIHEGLDFFYNTETHARKMVDFLLTVLPCRSHNSKKLISHDIRSNIYNSKYTFCVEVVPLSKDSVVCLPKQLAQQLGGISPICIVYRVTSSVHLIDPTRSQIADISSTVYWRTPFNSICDPKHLVEYVVMDIEPILDKDRKFFPGQGHISTKHVLVDVWVVRASDLGAGDDNTIHTRSHLGHVLRIGDSVLGYNIQDANINDSNFEKLNKDNMPDVILIKKYYNRSQRKNRRMWKLKHMANEEDVFLTDNKGYDDFLDDLEEDPDLRQNVNIFKDNAKTIPVDAFDVTNEVIPQITLEEMLDDLDITDV